MSEHQQAMSRIERKRLAYRHTFLDSSNGRLLPMAEEVLQDLRRVSGIDRGGLVISHASQMTDPYATAYRAGQRDLYLRIVKFLELEGFSGKENRDDGHDHRD
jgi:hypothetical protein